MNDFKNNYILADTPYQAGLFPQIPNFRKEGSVFILTEGIADDLVVNDKTTQRQIRQGKYKRLVEISTKPYRVETHFESPGKEEAYSFAVYVKAVIQVNNPLAFYNNRNLDVDAYFENLFALDVRKITRKYSILNYQGMDDELTEKLSSYNGFDETSGFTYRISIVDAEPGPKAKPYVEKHSTQKLNMALKQDARKLTEHLAKDMEKAILTEVVEGKISEREAYLQIARNQEESFDAFLARIQKMRDEGFLTDEEAHRRVRSQAMPVISNGTESGKSLPPFQDKESNASIDAFYEDEENDG